MSVVRNSSFRRALPVFPVVACALLSAQVPAQTAPSPDGTAPPAVVAVTDGEQTGVRFEVTELKRTSGGTLTLKFTLVNDSEKGVAFGYSYGYGQSNVADFASIGGIHLVDAAGKKKYLVVRDGNGKCVCSQGLGTVDPGSRVNLWAKFPAPPEDVTLISVVIPHAIPLDDVPIS